MHVKFVLCKRKVTKIWAPPVAAVYDRRTKTIPGAHRDAATKTGLL
jgi:hypothetical protein